MTKKYKNLYDLTGKVAVVTGAAGILGQHFCEGLADFGAQVVAVDVSEEQLAQLEEQLQQQSLTVHTKLCNVADANSVSTLFAELSNEYGKIDVLLNNAATKTNDLAGFFTDFEHYRLAKWREVMAVNLDGMFLVAQAAGKYMVKQKSGSIINTASIYGVIGPDQRIYEGSHYLGRKIISPAVYSVSKAGVCGLTRHLAALWGVHGVRVNTLVPGGVQSGQNDAFVKKYSDTLPMQRMAQPEEMVGPVIFLASDSSSYITGQDIIVDGGKSIW